MFDEINREIRECKEKIMLKQTLEKKLKMVEETLDIKEKLLKNLNKILNKEYKDVQNLEKLSLVNILATIIGNKEDKLYKEEQEYIQAKIKYDECLLIVEGYKNDRNYLISRIKEIDYSEDRYAELIREKGEKLKTFDFGIKQELVRLENLLDIEKQNGIEIIEAKAEADRCKNIISEAIDQLESAKSWGTYDMFGGGGLSSIIKHERIRDAKNKLQSLGYAVQKLNFELNDVNMSLANEGLDSLSDDYLIDVFFDNIFTDWSVQDKIKDSLRKVNGLYKRVLKISDELEIKEKRHLEEVENLKENINKLIENN